MSRTELYGPRVLVFIYVLLVSDCESTDNSEVRDIGQSTNDLDKWLQDSSGLEVLAKVPPTRGRKSKEGQEEEEGVRGWPRLRSPGTNCG